MLTTVNAMPHDPVLTQLAQTLDESVMRSVFAEVVEAAGVELVDCCVERIKYRPRRNCTLSYRLSLRHTGRAEIFDQRVAARLCHGGDSLRRAARAQTAPLSPSLAGPSVRLIPALDMLTWWWPNDAKLIAPRVFDDANTLRTHVLPEVVASLSGGRGKLIDYRAEVVQYVPELRLCARVALRLDGAGLPGDTCVFAKTSREPDSATAHAVLQALQTSPKVRSGHLRVARALLHQPRFDLHWQQGVPGRALSDVPAVAAAAYAATLGAQLAALHATPLAVVREITAQSLEHRLEEVTEVLRDALPESHDGLRRVSLCLREGLKRFGGFSFATLHGDLHPRNAIVNGGELVLIDLDGMRHGPSVLELGAWIADGIYRAHLDGAPPMRDMAAWQTLVEAYARAGGERPRREDLAWATAWNLVCQRAWRCVVNLKPGRFAIAPDLVALAARIAETRSLESM